MFTRRVKGRIARGLDHNGLPAPTRHAESQWFRHAAAEAMRLHPHERARVPVSPTVEVTTSGTAVDQKRPGSGLGGRGR